MRRLTCTLALLLALAATPVAAERVKDLAAIAGVRSNQLIGYGLIVGLNGTGDQTSQVPFAGQSMKSMLAQFGIAVPPNVNPQLKNVAAVAVSAELPPFAKPGQRIDITVSSIGNAKSLRGGTLLMAPLRGADGAVYAMAQGNLIVGGLSASGEDGSRITVNVPSVGRIPNGATVERVVSSTFNSGDHLTLNLHTGDFTTANRLATVINDTFGAGTAQALDATSVKVLAPSTPSSRVAFVALVENLEVQPGDGPAKVIINSRTGTVIIGNHVKVKPVAVAHGSMIVTITANPLVSQPPALSGGTTAVVSRTDIAVREEESRMFLFGPGTTLSEIVRAINRVGAAPSDVVAILEALKQAGALSAELTVI